MMREEIEMRVERHADGAGSAAAMSAGSEPSLGELFRRLSSDTADLVKQEASLAKAEIAASAAVLAKDATKVGVGAGLALAGILSLTAFLVVGLGVLLSSYWLSALIIGVVMLAVGGMMAKHAISDVKRRGLKPRQTMATLRADASWAEQHAHDLKHDMTAETTAANPKR
jgi:uncharacterized membrane protein YqjE